MNSENFPKIFSKSEFGFSENFSKSEFGFSENFSKSEFRGKVKFFKGVEFGFWKKIFTNFVAKVQGGSSGNFANFSEGEFGFWKSFKGNEFRKKFKGNEFGFWKSCGKKTKSENRSFFDTFWRIAQ